MQIMDQQYAESHYVEDLESLIKHHELQLVSLDAEQMAAKGFEAKIKTDCDNIVEDIKKLDAHQNFESDETLQQQRKELSDKLIFMWQKLKWFGENIAECESEKKEIAGELHILYMQRLHISVVHNK